MPQKIVVIIGKGGGIEIVSDSPLQVHLLDRNIDGAAMVSVIDGALCDVQCAELSVDSERFQRICDQMDKDLVSVDDLDDVDFKISKDLDYSATATHDGPFFKAKLTVSRPEPDAADGDRRAKVDLVIDIEASDGRKVHREETDSVNDDGLRGYIQNWIDDHASSRDDLSDTLDSFIRPLNFSAKIAGKTPGM